LLKISFKLTDRGGRARDMGSNSLNIAGHVMIWLVLQMAGFKAIEDFFEEAPAGARFTWH
jgi:hypothetical protein